MRKNYFTNENIDLKSKDILKSLNRCRRNVSLPFKPEKSALLILDMQRFFLDERSHAFIPSAAPIVPRIKQLAYLFVERGLPVILTRHLNTKKNAGLMDVWWRDLIDESDKRSEIVPDLRLPESVVQKKTQYDAFYQTSLEDDLRGGGVTQLVVTGVMTHLCCETTARSAFMRGFVVFFPVNGTATYNEEYHRAALLNLSHGFAQPVLVEELKNRVEAWKVEG